MENSFVINLEPNAGSALGYGWQKMKNNFVNLLVVILILMVAQSLSGFSNSGSNPSFSERSLSFVIWLLIAGPIAYSSAWVFLKAVRGDAYDIKDVFACFSKDYFEIMLANFLVTIIIIIGFVFLIIPGIIFAVKLAFVPYLVMDKQMKAMDAIKASWEMTRGYFWQIFFLGFISFFIVLGGLILFIIGIFPVVMWIQSSMASLFFAVDSKSVQ